MMGGFGFFGLGMVLMVLFWVAVIGGAIWLVAALVRGNQGMGASGTGSGTGAQAPLDILQTRYAKGEITQEQFEEMKRTLGLATGTESQVSQAER